jgi:hypothetical protein
MKAWLSEPENFASGVPAYFGSGKQMPRRFGLFGRFYCTLKTTCWACYQGQP